MLPYSPIVPQRCYRDARPALEFLNRAFGFEARTIIPDAGDGILHAELWTGQACILLASLPTDDRWRYRVPREIGGINTGSPYLATTDIDALYARARTAGCTIVSELAQTEYGSRDFSARDNEGFLWHFGTYRPRADPNPVAAAERGPELFAGMRYTDAPAAIAWLSRAFGATADLVIPGPADSIAHAQLLIGDGLFMLGSGRDDDFGLRSPVQLDGFYTQTLTVYVADPDRHAATATDAGAVILAPPANAADGARGYVARDPEGYVWSFSTYRPGSHASRATVPATAAAA